MKEEITLQQFKDPLPGREISKRKLWPNVDNLAHTMPTVLVSNGSLEPKNARCLKILVLLKLLELNHKMIRIPLNAMSFKLNKQDQLLPPKDMVFHLESATELME
jgi:hypothetical protein